MSIDPEKLKKSHETLKSTPVKPLRSKLAPAADVVMDLHAKGYPLREIATWLAEHLDLRVSVSTLHAFLISVQKQKARQSEVERRSLGSTHLSSASTNAVRELI